MDDSPSQVDSCSSVRLDRLLSAPCLSLYPPKPYTLRCSRFRPLAAFSSMVPLPLLQAAFKSTSKKRPGHLGAFGLSTLFAASPYAPRNAKPDAGKAISVLKLPRIISPDSSVSSRGLPDVDENTPEPGRGAARNGGGGGGKRGSSASSPMGGEEIGSGGGGSGDGARSDPGGERLRPRRGGLRAEGTGVLGVLSVLAGSRDDRLPSTSISFRAPGVGAQSTRGGRHRGGGGDSGSGGGRRGQRQGH